MFGNSSPRVTISANKTIPDTLNLVAGNLAIGANTLTAGGRIIGNGRFSANGTSSNLVVNGSVQADIRMNQDTNGVTNRLNNLSINSTTDAYLYVTAQCEKTNRTVKHIWFLPTPNANAEKPKELVLSHSS